MVILFFPNNKISNNYKIARKEAECYCKWSSDVSISDVKVMSLEIASEVGKLAICIDVVVRVSETDFLTTLVHDYYDCASWRSRYYDCASWRSRFAYDS